MTLEVYVILTMFAWVLLMLTYKPKKNDIKDIIISFVAICIVSCLWPIIAILVMYAIFKAFIKVVLRD
jgi:hypothetical protein